MMHSDRLEPLFSALAAWPVREKHPYQITRKGDDDGVKATVGWIVCNGLKWRSWCCFSGGWPGGNWAGNWRFGLYLTEGRTPQNCISNWFWRRKNTVAFTGKTT